MQHYRSLDTVQLTNSWVTIGSFDGIHRGHQILIQQLVKAAHDAGSTAVVVTFFPHPVKVLRDLPGPFYLTDPEEKARLIESLGVDAVVTLPFDHQMANLTAEQFMQMLVDHLDIQQLWVGDDFALGRGREGNVARLSQLGETMGFQVHVIAPVMGNSEKISSSEIRTLLQAGEMEKAANFLGRWYSLSGKVVAGDARGRSLGIPTANVDVWIEEIIPAYGVYASRTIVNGQVYPSVTNVGVRPMFTKPPVPATVESHILDFDGDLYGQEITVEFIHLLRPEIHFASIVELLEQIRVDIAQTKEILSHVT